MSEFERVATKKARPRHMGHELAELAKTHTLPGGLLVLARCFAYRGPTRTRYEIVVEGFGRRAVVDAVDRDTLPLRIDQAMAAFEETARARRVVDSRR